MKKTTFSLLVVVTLTATIFSCDRFSKEQRTVNKFEGTWDLSDFKLKINKKDTSLIDAKRIGTLHFDYCSNAKDSNKCSVSFTITGTKVVNDLYYPMGYQVFGKTKLQLLWKNKKYYFKIKKSKSSDIEFAGTDSLFSEDNSNLIKAKKRK